MTDYKPLDLGPMWEREGQATRGPWRMTSQGFIETFHQEDDLHSDVLMLGKDGTHADGEFAAHARDDVPALLAEVVRLRREVAHGHIDCGAECWRGLRYDQLRDDACPICQAAALDDWDPSKPLDWKPEEKA